MQNLTPTKTFQFHDTHAHLDLLLEKLGLVSLESCGKISILEKNLDDEIQNLLLNHEFLTHATVSAENFINVFEFFKKYEKVRFLIGSHPEIVNQDFDVKNYLKNQENILKTVDLKSKNIVGIGEIGLDYYHEKNPEVQKKQQKLFESQIELAINLGFSIQIHSRNAFADTFEIIKNYPQIYNKFSFHCFSEGVEELKKILDLGGFIGVGGVSTYKNAEAVREAVQYCPKENFMLETDLPFLAPPPFRGKINLPNMIEIIGKNTGFLKNMSEGEVWENSRKNFEELFNYKI